MTRATATPIPDIAAQINNLVVLRGSMNSSPTTRVTATGQVCDAVLRVWSLDGITRVREQVPLTWSGDPGRFAAAIEGADLVVCGRVRQRFFRSGAMTVSRTEVVVSGLVAMNRRASVKKILGPLLEAVGSMVDE